MAMKIACHKSDKKACLSCAYRYVCERSAYHKHDDVRPDRPLQVDSVLNAASDNPVSNRAVAAALEALQALAGRWGGIDGNIKDQADLMGMFGLMEQDIQGMQSAIGLLRTPIPMYYVQALLEHGNMQPVTAKVNLDESTFADGVLSWAPVEGVTVSQLRGSGVANVNASYANPPRLYKGHILEVRGTSNKSIFVVSVKCDGSYYGANLAVGTRLDGNGCVVDDSAKIGRELTTTSYGTHTFTVNNKSGEEVVYIQNLSDDDNRQLRPVSVSVTYLIPLDEDVPGYLNYEGLKTSVSDILNRINLLGNSLSSLDFERGRMSDNDLYAWYSNNAHRIGAAYYNLIGDYCFLSLIDLETIAGWQVVYYSLPVGCIVPAHGLFKTQEGTPCYWAIAVEPNTGVNVLRIAAMEEDAGLPGSKASMQICYKYK